MTKPVTTDPIEPEPATDIHPVPSKEYQDQVIADAHQALSLRRVLERWGTPPAAMVGKLPRSTKRDNPKGKCHECGGWHGLPAVHLDFVGHADVTRALIEEDPTWNWEPVSFDTDGSPLIRIGRNNATMWIRLTIHGVTRLGCGTAEVGKPELEKELISDALRNAAMRFGIALSLWSKSEWTDLETEPTPTPDTPAAEALPLSQKQLKHQLVDLVARNTGQDRDGAQALTAQWWADNADTILQPASLETTATTIAAWFAEASAA